MHKTAFSKSLTLYQSVFIGLAWMTPMIFFTVYGVAFETSGGMLASSFVIAFIAIFFTAFSYSQMVKAYPIAGSAFTFTKKTISPRIGFLVGWALLIDYLLSPLIACLTFGIYLNAQFPSIPTYVWIILFNLLLTVINILGIKSVASVSRISVLIQIVFIVFFCILIVVNLFSSIGGGEVFTIKPFFTSEMSVSTLFAGASLICFCFLGFDAITTTAEETINPTKNIPKAIYLIITIAATLYISVSYLTQVAYPNFSFENPDTAAFQLVKLVGGSALSSLFIAVLVVAIFTQGVSSTTSISRFLFALGREGILPKKFFSFIHPKFKTPVFNIIFVSFFSLLALFMELNTAVSLVSFGALIAFMFVNISVISHYYVRKRQRSFKQTFLYLIFPLIGAGFIGWLLSLVHKQTLIIGICWLVIGIVYRLLTKYVISKKRLLSKSNHVA